MALLKSLLTAEVQAFIKEYDEDISKLAFAGSPFPSVPIQSLLEQISSRRQIKDKLPTWFSTDYIYYPPKLNLEQTSSEITAQHKARFVEGETLADITGGFGVDTNYFAEKITSVTHFEKNETLSEIARHNAKQLDVSNITFRTGNSIALLEKQYDIIFADPGRRTASRSKVFLLKDCLPNIPDNLEHILNHTKLLLLKTSPILDISMGLNELKNVSEIHVVAVNNEVKELLWFITALAPVEKPKIYTFNYSKNKVDTFETTVEDYDIADYSKPKAYLFEPNAAILKSGAFNAVANDYKIFKLAENSHLYTSDKLIDFPGRRFEIIKVMPYNRKEMRSFLKSKANVSIRNFPESVAQIRKKWKIKDGGMDYLFFTSLENNERVVIKGKPIR